MSTTDCSGKQDIDALKEKVEVELQAIRGLQDNVKQEKLADVKQMIAHYTQATSVIEDRRASMHSVSLQLLGLSVAACALVATVQDGLWDNWLARAFLVFTLIIGAILFVSATVAVIIFEAQSGFRYPFLELSEYGNRWKWFYYGNPSIPQIGPNAMRWQKDLKADMMLYVEGLAFFAEKYRKEDLDGELCDGIIHLYLLQVHNYYKNRWYLHLTSVWWWTYWLVGGVAFLFAVYVAIASLGGCFCKHEQAAQQATSRPAATASGNGQPVPPPSTSPTTSAVQQPVLE